MVTQFTEADPGELHTLLNEAMERAISEIRSQQAVANFGALPTANNWQGRIIETTDNGWIYKWNGTAWTIVYENTGWIDLTLTTSPALAGLASTPQYRRVGGKTELRGTVTSTGGALITSGLVAATLPVGFRPEAILRDDSPTSGSTDTIRRINITTAGVITLNESGSGSVTWQSLDGIFFDAA